MILPRAPMTHQSSPRPIGASKSRVQWHASAKRPARRDPVALILDLFAQAFRSVAENSVIRRLCRIRTETTPAGHAGARRAAGRIASTVNNILPTPDPTPPGTLEVGPPQVAPPVGPGTATGPADPPPAASACLPTRPPGPPPLRPSPWPPQRNPFRWRRRTASPPTPALADAGACRCRRLLMPALPDAGVCRCRRLPMPAIADADPDAC